MAAKFVRLLLHNRYDDIESVFAERCGTTDRGVLLRINNVPFLHSRPTFDDVVEAIADDEFEGAYAWDRKRIPFSKIRSRIHTEGGRYAAIVDYTMERLSAYRQLIDWLEETLDVVTEGCVAPADGRPGRLYMALPRDMDVDLLVASMAAEFPSMAFELMHPVQKGAKKRSSGRATKVARKPAKKGPAKTGARKAVTQRVANRTPKTKPAKADRSKASAKSK